MIINEMREMDYSELLFRYLVSTLIIYNLTLDCVVITNEFTRKGFLTTTFIFYTYSNNGHCHNTSIRTYRKQHESFLKLVKDEFPELNIVDNRDYKE